eukprot:scaffold3016_cov415-Prasinococcus_capsulatus_cf.AAC.5
MDFEDLPAEAFVRDMLARKWQSSGGDADRGEIESRNSKDVDALISRISSESLLVLTPPSDGSTVCT